MSSNLGQQMHAFVAELQPIVRSITGEGLRETLRRIGRRIPLTIHEVPSGTRVFDWTVPKEWNVREAYVVDPDGRRVIDLKKHPLHLMGYSTPVRKRMSLGELREHVYSLPEHPDWIPYRTSYYEPSWGFCLAHRELQKLNEGEYEVVIDSALADGSMSYGECFIPGTSDEEILFSIHACHPGLCNDNLSAIAVATELAASLRGRRDRYGYRFVFAPGTIGAITWLAQNEEKLPRIKHGLMLAMLGDAGPFTYKKSRRGDAEIDRTVLRVLRKGGVPFAVEHFSPYGYDERQYCSPGFNLPIGRLTRTPHGKFPEYHTSADDLDFVKAESLEQSLKLLSDIVSCLQQGVRYLNLNPKCEPQLGKRGLFRPIGGVEPQVLQMAMLWLLNYSDGGHDLTDIAERSEIATETLTTAAELLEKQNLLRRL